MIGDLAETGFVIDDEFLSADEIDLVKREFRARLANDEFHRAGVGKRRVLDSSLRGDLILWLGNSGQLNPGEEIIFTRLESLKRELNRRYLLGLRSVEAHFAIYPPGEIYQKHIDRFQDDDSRVVSCVLYLNLDWTHSDGGELVLYARSKQALPVDKTGVETADPQEVVVLPQAQRAVYFLSAEIQHEVRASQRERLSIAAWFRR